MDIMASGYAHGHVHYTQDGGSSGEVTEDGGHSPANRLTETCSLGCM